MTDLEKVRESAHHHLAKVRHHLAEASSAIERVATQLGAPVGPMETAPPVRSGRTAIYPPKGAESADKAALATGDDFRKAFGEHRLEANFNKAAGTALENQIRKAASGLPDDVSAVMTSTYRKNWSEGKRSRHIQLISRRCVRLKSKPLHSEASS
jgi:hypothetical protein